MEPENCPKCGEDTDEVAECTGDDRLLVCPACGIECCADCIAGVGVACNECEEAGDGD